MFIEIIKANGEKKLIKIDTGAHLEYCYPGFVSYRGSYAGSNEPLLQGNQIIAEALYEKIKKLWVGNDYLEIIKR